MVLIICPARIEHRTCLACSRGWVAWAGVGGPRTRKRHTLADRRFLASRLRLMGCVNQKSLAGLLIEKSNRESD